MKPQFQPDIQSLTSSALLLPTPPWHEPGKRTREGKWETDAEGGRGSREGERRFYGRQESGEAQVLEGPLNSGGNTGIHTTVLKYIKIT
jgi:hypothetical protein